MSSLAVSALLELVDRSGNTLESGPKKRIQGRPARGENEVGVQKIVEGMRAALRALQSTKVSRKHVAGHAGVTPALVTYYFPERNSLVEAATLPVVQALVDKVRTSIERDGSLRQRLCAAIEVMLETHSRDAAVIELFSHHRASTPDTALPDLLRELDVVVESLFEAWLLRNPGVYNAAFLRKAMMGACRNLVRRPTEGSEMPDAGHRSSAEMVCSMLLGPASATEAMKTPALVGVGIS